MGNSNFVKITSGLGLAFAFGLVVFVMYFFDKDLRKIVNEFVIGTIKDYASKIKS